MGDGCKEGSRSIEETPTWAVAAVCLVFVLISILIEQAIHHIGHWLNKHHKKGLYEALEKIKDELMLVGFISLLLTVGQKPISKICISKSLGDTMLPCKKKDDKTSKPDKKYDSSLQYCSEKGKVPLISYYGMHDLHIFIFVLAVFHVLYSVITMALGNAKMFSWKAWEQETKTMEYEYSHDPAQLRFTRETSFGQRHMNFWTRTPILIWIVCFFRQFFTSVSKVDYLTLRHGFILVTGQDFSSLKAYSTEYSLQAHLAPNSKFDFNKYIKRSLEDDFKVIVGISFPLWAFAVIFLLLNIHDNSGRWNKASSHNNRNGIRNPPEACCSARNSGG
eukprot:Gb_28679 [translate_table: standard]